MSCDRVQERLSELLDGGLPATERAEIEAHLRSCVPCRRLARDLERLGQRVREWDPAVTPGRDLWPGVAGRIGAGVPTAADDDGASVASSGRRLTRWVLAAAAALAIGLAVPVAVDRLAAPGGSPEVEARRARDRQAYEELVAAAVLARVADGTLQPRRDLENVLAAHHGRFDEETVAALRVEVDRLQTAIGEIYLALENQPENRRLRMLLAARYRQETDLLRRLGRV